MRLGLAAMVVAGAVAIGAPGRTWAADGGAFDSLEEMGKTSALQFKSGSPEATLLAQTRRWAWPLLFLGFLAGLIFELAMGTDARYGVVVRRLVLAVFLLTFYNASVGTMVNALGDLAQWLSPPAGAITDYMTKANQARIKAKMAEVAASGQATGAPPSALSNPLEWAKAQVASAGTSAGTALFDTAIYFTILLCEAILFIILLTGKILVAMLYILGPIALALGVPRASGVAGKWFKELVTFGSWPIFIAIFLSLLSAIGAAGAGSASVLGALVSAGIMAASALSVPAVATSLVGGALGNIGERAAGLVESKGHALPGAAAQHAQAAGKAGAGYASGAVRAVASAAGFGGGSSGTGGGTGGATGGGAAASSPPATGPSGGASSSAPSTP